SSMAAPISRPTPSILGKALGPSGSPSSRLGIWDVPQKYTPAISKVQTNMMRSVMVKRLLPVIGCGGMALPRSVPFLEWRAAHIARFSQAEILTENTWSCKDLKVSGPDRGTLKIIPVCRSCYLDKALQHVGSA